MTTVIACRALGTVVADTRVSHGESRFKSSKKVQRIGKYLVGVAGDYSRALAYLKVFSNEAREMDGKTAPKLPPAEAGGEGDSYIELMAMSQHGLWLYGSDGTPIEVEEEFYAIGTGSAWANASLRTQELTLAAYDLRMAMEVACEHDNDSGLPMVELKFNEEGKDDDSGTAAAKPPGAAGSAQRGRRQRRVPGGPA